MRAMRLLAVLFVLLSGCASNPAPIGYTWQGQPGAAVTRYGSPEAAQAAVQADAAACDYEVQKAEAARGVHPAQGSLAGALLFASAGQDKAESLHRACMASRGWHVHYGER